MQWEARQANLAWAIARHSVLTGREIRVCGHEGESQKINELIDRHVSEMKKMTWSL